MHFEKLLYGPITRNLFIHIKIISVMWELESVIYRKTRIQYKAVSCLSAHFYLTCYLSRTKCLQLTLRPSPKTGREKYLYVLLLQVAGETTSGKKKVNERYQTACKKRKDLKNNLCTRENLYCRQKRILSNKVSACTGWLKVDGYTCKESYSVGYTWPPFSIDVKNQI